MVVRLLEAVIAFDQVAGTSGTAGRIAGQRRRGTSGG